MERATAALKRLEVHVFEPATLPRGTVLAIAMAPGVLAGLVFFQGRAAAALAVALAVGGALQVPAWRLRREMGIAPTVAAVVAVALVGAAAPLEWVAVAAAMGASLEVARARWVPWARVQTGVVAAAVVFLASAGASAAYLSPNRLRPMVEPIRLWSDYAGGGATAPIDPVRLYVGNVAGPMFATSLLAVVIGAAWMWYAHRLSLAVVAGFLAGAALPIWLWHWDAGYQLDSGPTWFLIALVLADRGNLPDVRAARPLLGVAAGVIGVGLRQRGLGIELMALAVAGLQVAVAAVEVAGRPEVQRAGAAGRLPGPGRGPAKPRPVA